MQAWAADGRPVERDDGSPGTVIWARAHALTHIVRTRFGDRDLPKASASLRRRPARHEPDIPAYTPRRATGGGFRGASDRIGLTTEGTDPRMEPPFNARHPALVLVRRRAHVVAPLALVLALLGAATLAPPTLAHAATERDRVDRPDRHARAAVAARRLGGGARTGRRQRRNEQRGRDGMHAAMGADAIPAPPQPGQGRSRHPRHADASPSRSGVRRVLRVLRHDLPRQRVAGAEHVSHRRPRAVNMRTRSRSRSLRDLPYPAASIHASPDGRGLTGLETVVLDQRLRRADRRRRQPVRVAGRGRGRADCGAVGLRRRQPDAVGHPRRRFPGPVGRRAHLRAAQPRRGDGRAGHGAPGRPLPGRRRAVGSPRTRLPDRGTRLSGRRVAAPRSSRRADPSGRKRREGPGVA